MLGDVLSLIIIIASYKGCSKKTVTDPRISKQRVNASWQACSSVVHFILKWPKKSQWNPFVSSRATTVWRNVRFHSLNIVFSYEYGNHCRTTLCHLALCSPWFNGYSDGSWDARNVWISGRVCNRTRPFSKDVSRQKSWIVLDDLPPLSQNRMSTLGPQSFELIDICLNEISQHRLTFQKQLFIICLPNV